MVWYSFRKIPKILFYTKQKKMDEEIEDFLYKFQKVQTTNLEQFIA